MFNDKSTFVGYSMPKPSSKKNNDTIKPIVGGWGDNEVHTFSKGICLKMNVIMRLEFELA